MVRVLEIIQATIGRKFANKKARLPELIPFGEGPALAKKTVLGAHKAEDFVKIKFVTYAGSDCHFDK